MALKAKAKEYPVRAVTIGSYNKEGQKYERPLLTVSTVGVRGGQIWVRGVAERRVRDNM